jgi:hypothetical protein
MQLQSAGSLAAELLPLLPCAGSVSCRSGQPGPAGGQAQLRACVRCTGIGCWLREECRVPAREGAGGGTAGCYMSCVGGQGLMRVQGGWAAFGRPDVTGAALVVAPLPLYCNLPRTSRPLSTPLNPSHAPGTMRTVVDLARCPSSERVLSDADLVGLVTSMLLDGNAGCEGRATRAAHGLCLASKSVCAAVLASVRRVRMDAPLPEVLRRMPSLVSSRRPRAAAPGPPRSCGS